MSLGISTDLNDMYMKDSFSKSGSVDALKLKSKLENVNVDETTDEELMEVCKSFESYMIENMYKSLEKTIVNAEDKSGVSALDYLGDLLPKAYAESATDQGGIGIAKQLYDAMKRK